MPWAAPGQNRQFECEDRALAYAVECFQAINVCQERGQRLGWKRCFTLRSERKRQLSAYYEIQGKRTSMGDQLVVQIFQTLQELVHDILGFRLTQL